MLAPLDAISLASAVIQIVDVGCKLLKEGYGVYHSVHGAPEESKDVEMATERLQNLCGRLPNLRQAKPGQPKTREESALDQLSKDCKVLAEELLTILHNLKVHSTGSLRTWETVRKTIQRHSKADKIKGLRKRLDILQADVNTHILAILLDDQSQLLQTLSRVAEDARAMHFSQLGLLEEKKDQLKAVLLSNEKAHDVTVKRQERLLHTILTQLGSLQGEAAAITLSKNVLASLHFETMYTRHQQVHKAHKNTFSWIFDASQTPCRSWLEKGDGVFWISGKAGSGKSTLLKYIAARPETESILQVWAQANGRALIQAKHFFWNAGASMQKSQEGLMQSMVFQVFSAFPEVIQLATPTRRWNADEAFHRNPEPWELGELTEALTSAVRHGVAHGKCFCFFIDGLDEYIGDHGKLVDVLDWLVTLPAVKLCVSSRPWNVFRDAYCKREDRKLSVHEHTESDMDQFIKDQLEEDKRFKSITMKDPRIMRLAKTIRERAMGVFLWVFLVVRRLSRLAGEMQHMDKETRLQTLERALNELPSDLNDFFKHMIDSIEAIHRTHTAGTFKLAMHAAPLPLIASWNLPSVMVRPDTILKAPIEYEDDDEEFVTKTTDTINAWCKDLLEVNKVADGTSAAVSELNYRIDFLHRTVRDFLDESCDVQQMFSDHLHPEFDPGATLLWLYLAQAKVLKIRSGPGRDLQTFMAVAQQFMRSTKAQEDKRCIVDPRMCAELDRVGVHYRDICGYGEKEVLNIKRSHWTNEAPRTDLRVFHLGQLGNSNFLAYAVAHGLVLYVKQQLATSGESLENGAGSLLLNYALYNVIVIGDGTSSSDAPSYDMVMLLLQAGASANVDASGRHDSSHTPWKLYLRRCHEQGGRKLWPVAKLLLQFGADPKASMQKVERLRLSSNTDGYSTSPHEAAPASAYECLRHVAFDNQKELDEVMGIKRQEDSACRQVEETVRQKDSLLVRIGRNLVPRQRRA